jgi:ABC-type transporter Mla MlaB component
MDHPPGPTHVIVCDVGWLTIPDAATLDALARLQMSARRFGSTVELHNACPRLIALIELVGLSDVLVVAGSGVEVERQIEERE